MDKYAQQAFIESCCENCSPHPGGVDGRAYWNIHASQFIFAPKLQFPRVPKGRAYLYTARVKDGTVLCFQSETSCASLSPIWGKIPEGFVELKVESLDKQGNILQLVGIRTFYKCAPFPGRNHYPPKAKSYRDCALAAFRFVYKDPMVQHWLEHGTPDPNYPHNAYPAKTVESIIRAMIYYAKLEPDNANHALKLARRAADYLLSISFPDNHPLAGLPPTYFLQGLNENIVHEIAPAAKQSLGTTMMIYPVNVAIAYLMLFDAVKDQKYFDAALQIAEYYKKTVLPSGSWYLLFDCNTGKPLTNNICVDFQFVNFFHLLYRKTQNPTWRELEIGCYQYISKISLKTYLWEGQFEDVKVSDNYLNLTHFTANHMIEYISQNLANDKKMVAEAIDMMHFVEDQFVVWGEFPHWDPGEKDRHYHTPAGLEQYFCYAPIDSSTATIMNAFLNMYILCKDRLYLEKALTLADAVTRHQDAESGMIPTFWIGENCAEGRSNFWINCQIHSAFMLMKLAEFTEKNGIE